MTGGLVDVLVPRIVPGVAGRARSGCDGRGRGRLSAGRAACRFRFCSAVRDGLHHPPGERQGLYGSPSRSCEAGGGACGVAAGQRSQDRRSVGRFRCLDLALEPGDLVAQDEYLGVFGAVGPGEHGEPAWQAEHRQVGESWWRECCQCLTGKCSRS